MNRIRKTILKNDCSMEVALNIISGKWKPFILTSLLSGPARPRDLIDNHPDFTKRVLMQQLRELETDGIIFKTMYPGAPVKVEYALTPMGILLRPIIEELNKFGDIYISEFHK